MSFALYLLSLLKKNKAPAIEPQPEPVAPQSIKVEPIFETPSYIVSALNDLGTKEIGGKGHNKKIQEYFLKIGFGKGVSDETPWCAAFVGYHMKTNGYALPKRPAAAKSWLDFGLPCDRFVKYSICVLYRNKAKTKYHVGFAFDENEKQVCLLNGNSSDQVKYTWFDKSMIVGYRWPVK